MYKQSLLLVTVLIVLGFAACNKEESGHTLRVRLTDAPTALDEVNVDLQQVQVKMDRDSASWVSLTTKAGIYNLLDLQNGVDTLIAEGDVGAGTVKEIRLVLGNNNSVVANGETHDLTIPSGSQSGLKIKISKPMRTTLDSLVIDFDAALSVKQERDGYRLRPVLRIK
jgi:hypothetical protein